jgi:hypothetical protein
MAYRCYDLCPLFAGQCSRANHDHLYKFWSILLSAGSTECATGSTEPEFCSSALTEKFGGANFAARDNEGSALWSLSERDRASQLMGSQNK